MRILLLMPQLPWPTHQGTALRNFHIIKGLAEHHEVSLLCYGDAVEFGPLVDLCSEIVTVPSPIRSTMLRLWQLISSTEPDMRWRLNSFDFNAVLHSLLTETTYDIVQIEGVELAHAINIVRDSSPTSTIVYDAHNAETALQQRAMQIASKQPARWPAAIYSWIQTRRLRRYEQKVCHSVDAVAAVSEQDCELLPLSPDKPVRVIPNCIDVSQYSDGSGQAVRYDVLFTGKMDYRPNVDAAVWFVNAIWPHVRLQLPEATCAFVGQRPHPRLMTYNGQNGITVTGFVPEVLPYLRGASVFVMPLRIGSGTRLKLLEAMAAGVPLVSTTLGAAGFPVEDGVHLYLRDEPHAFADAIIALLTDKEQATALVQQAQLLATAYDWRRVIPQFEQLYRQAQEKRK